MTVRLTVAAVRALHRGLDQAGGRPIRAARSESGSYVASRSSPAQRSHRMADRAPERSTGAPWHAARLHRKSSQITRYSKTLVTQRSARKSISSMIPTIAASTAVAFRPSASPAAFPSMTTSTVSPTPSSYLRSIVRSVVPARLPVRGHRLDEQQLGALELPVLPGRDDCADDPGYLHEETREAVENSSTGLLRGSRPRHPSDQLSPRSRHLLAAPRDRTGMPPRGRERRRRIRRRRRRPNRGDQRAAHVIAGAVDAAEARAASMPVRLASLTVATTSPIDTGELHPTSTLRLADGDRVHDADDRRRRPGSPSSPTPCAPSCR